MTGTWTVRRASFERPLVVALCGVFVACLQFAYANMDAKLFAFLGLRWKDIGPVWSVVGFAMAVVPSLWMPIRLQRPSMVAYWILYLTVIAPVVWIPFHTQTSSPASYAVFDLVLLGCFFGLGLSFRLPRFVVSRLDMSSDLFFLGVLGVTVVATMMVWSVVGFHLDLGLSSIYDRRRSAGEAIPMGSALSYVKGNLGSALQPFAFAVGIARRSAPLVLASILAGIVGFSVEGSKTSAAIPLFLLALYPLLTRYRAVFGLALPIAAIGFVLAAFWAHELTRDVRIPVVTTWRLFDVKGLLSGYYWEFFSHNPKMCLSDGILRPFFTNPYPYAAPEEIGLVYFGSPMTNSNANLWASAFGDFGYTGMVAVTALLAAVFRLIDSMAVNRGFLVPAFLASFLGMKLSDVALDTSILSHGTLAILVLVYVLPPSGRAEREPWPVKTAPVAA